MTAWTDTKLQALAIGWQAGLGSAELAADLGVSVSAVRSKRHHMGLPERSVAAAAAINLRNGIVHDTGLRAAARPGRKPPAKAFVDAFARLAGSTPRPIEQRMRGECCWPIGADLWSCCLPVVTDERGAASIYCAGHLRMSRDSSWRDAADAA